MINKIFQIGFNKCGTTSIYHLFSKYSEPKLKCVHWDYGFLAKNIYDNLNNGLPLLSGKYEDVTIFTDIECNLRDENNSVKFLFGYKLFKKLDEQYPHSKFILNTRNIDEWISSRIKHLCNYEIVNNKLVTFPFKKTYYELYAEFLPTKSRTEIIDIWKNEWYEHHKDVLLYFHNKPNKLLVYDIDKDPLEKLFNFLNHKIVFSTPFLPKTNISND